MRDTLLLLVLAPLLIWQGRRVRQRTLRLPEAAGPRHGCVGQGQALRVLLLGRLISRWRWCQQSRQRFSRAVS